MAVKGVDLEMDGNPGTILKRILHWGGFGLEHMNYEQLCKT